VRYARRGSQRQTSTSGHFGRMDGSWRFQRVQQGWLRGAPCRFPPVRSTWRDLQAGATTWAEPECRRIVSATFGAHQRHGVHYHPPGSRRSADGRYVRVSKDGSTNRADAKRDICNFDSIGGNHSRVNTNGIAVVGL